MLYACCIFAFLSNEWKLILLKKKKVNITNSNDLSQLKVAANQLLLLLKLISRFNSFCQSCKCFWKKHCINAWYKKDKFAFKLECSSKWLNSPISATIFAKNQTGKWNWYHSSAPGSPGGLRKGLLMQVKAE